MLLEQLVPRERQPDQRVTFQGRPAAYRQVAVDPEHLVLERPVVALVVVRLVALAPDSLARLRLAAAVAAEAAEATVEQTQSMRSS